MIAARRNTLRLRTRISGHINGQRFECSGEGEAFSDGRTKSELTFDSALRNFTPMLCASWKCKHHPGFVADPINPIAEFLGNGGKVVEQTVIEYRSFLDRWLFLSRRSERS